MMEQLVLVVGTIAALGCALVGGVFFAFSSFVMKALARLPSSEGIAAMQSVNVAVINRSFLGAFFGTALLSFAAVGLAGTRWDHPSAPFFLVGAVIYCLGTFLVTILGNVPLNDKLAAVSATDSVAAKLWEHYLDRWTMWNHVRAAAAMLAALFFILGIMKNGGA